jgi:GNAT superfamily N-acetyltransferase
MLTLTVDPNPPAEKIRQIRYGLLAYNMQQAPHLLDLPLEDLVAAAYAPDGTLIGGAVGEADWGWLYVDSLWVAAAQRGQDWGTRLLRSLEEAARQQGLVAVYLMTADFQALPFYQKLGYTVVGELADRPTGHRCYYLTRPLTLPQALDPQVHIVVQPDALLVGNISNSQLAASPIPIEFGEFAVWLTDEATLCGGLVCHSFWEWATLRWCWLDAAWRGLGYGKRLLALAEQTLREQGMRGLLLDVADFQNPTWFQRQGFTTIFTLPNRPPTSQSHFMAKRF